jgi:tRNA nucleotidyltransferase (CCA-adding enzyme)
MTGFKAYVVGGAVRDALLGLPVKDRDYVVVGARPEQLQAQGFVAVGKDFPVFLHPRTHEEYALARTERKTAPGYAGFAFHATTDVTLEQDLQRRDLTINAIAQDEDGTLIDPYGGRADIDARVFRHVSPAFAEDPVRILRVARFAARFTEFSVAPETMALMRQMVDTGEVDALVAERVWQEISRGLAEIKPSRMFSLLHDCGALARILPELHALIGVSLPEALTETATVNHAKDTDCFSSALRVLDIAAAQDFALPERFAVLIPNLGIAMISNADLAEDLASGARGVAIVEQLCKRLRVPHEVRDLAILVAREHAVVARADTMPAAGIVNLLERCDAFRKPARFIALLEVCECIHANGIAAEFTQKPLLHDALSVAQSVNAGAIAAEVMRTATERASDKIPEAIHAARVQAVAQALGLHE